MLRSTKWKVAEDNPTGSFFCSEFSVVVNKKSKFPIVDVKRKSGKDNVGSMLDIVSKNNYDWDSPGCSLGKVLHRKIDDANCKTYWIHTKKAKSIKSYKQVSEISRNT